MNDPQASDALDVRIAGFDTAHEAELARAYLISLDIPCRIEGDMIARESVFYSTALFEVRLIVPSAHAEEASSFLEEYRRSIAVDPSPESDASVVFRAFRASILGVALFPLGLHLFSVWLLRRIRYGELDPRSRRRFLFAQGINGSVLVLAGWLLFRWLR